MRKLFALILTICLIATMSVTAFAEETVVMRVTGLKNDGTVFVPEKSDFTNFKDGWVAAATYAKDSKWKSTNDIDRVVVDLLADWVAKGSLGSSGEGISDGAICFPMNTRITLNMNGHTINRGLTDWEYNGEVIYIREGANVIINNGTVTGGWSGNGAGGIHIDGKANVTLNDVRVVDNVADDDHGGGIAIHDRAVLTMNGGSISRNIVDGKGYAYDDYFGGGIYVYKSTAIFNGVDFIANQSTKEESFGIAIYATGSEVTINECLFDGNAVDDASQGYLPSFSVICAVDNSSVHVKKSTFANNGDVFYFWKYRTPEPPLLYASALFAIENSTLTMEDDNQIKDNRVVSLFNSFRKGNAKFYISDVTITDNASFVLDSSNHSADSYFKNCVFNNNIMPETEIYNDGVDYSFRLYSTALTFESCDFGDTLLLGDENVTLIDSNGYPAGESDEEPVTNPIEGSVEDLAGGLADEPNEEPAGPEGSIFSESSMTMFVAMTALVVSIVSLAVTFSSKKKTAEKAE